MQRNQSTPISYTNISSNNPNANVFNKENARIHEKDQLIKILEQKNDKLHKQIQRISRLMKENEQVSDKKTKEQLKRQSIIQTTNDPQILNRELNNCYKKIKLYEYEVDKLKEKALGGAASQKIITMTTEFKQKKLIQDRLKQEMTSLLRDIADNTKKLSGGYQQNEIEKQLKTKADELNFLRQMIKQHEIKENIKSKNLKKQYTYIKKLQKQFLQKGGSLHEAQSVKQKAVKMFEEGRLKQPSREVSDENYYQRFSKPSFKSISLNNSYQNPNTSNPQTEPIQDRTRTHYQTLVNQLNLLQKLNKKYEKQFEQAEKSLKQISGKSQLAQKRVQKLQKEIQQLNSSIKLKKTCIVADNMRPGHRKSLRSVQTHEDILNRSGINQSKRKRNIINMSSIQH